MIKKENTRIIITMSKEKAEMLKTLSQKTNLSVSKFINYAIDCFFIVVKEKEIKK